MKRLLAIAVIVTAFMASESYAQSATANVQLTVNGALAIAATHNLLNLGSVAAGTTASVAYSDANAALFTITSTNPGSSFSLTWSSSQYLSNGSWNLTPAYSVYGNGANLTTGAASLTSGGPALITDATTGNYYVFVGASVPVPSNAGGGTYNGTITMTVALN